MSLINQLRGLAVGMALTASALAGPAAALDIIPVATGQVSDAGGDSLGVTFVGSGANTRYNSWAAYQLPSLSFLNPLLIFNLSGTGTQHLIGVYDVSTPYSVFSSQSATAATYGDLGGGDQYAQVLYNTTNPIGVFLQGSATTNLNAAAGGIFVIGFTDLTQNALSDRGQQAGVTVGAPVLRVSTVAGIPEPATWGMMILGFVGMGALLRRRRSSGSLATEV